MSRHHPLPIRMGSRHKRALYGIVLALWASGALWLLFHYFLRVPGDFGDAAHPLESWWLRLHGLMAFASLVAIGSVLPIHARRAWQLNKNRRSGLAMKAYLLWLALTGYALYYTLCAYYRVLIKPLRGVRIAQVDSSGHIPDPTRSSSDTNYYELSTFTPDPLKNIFCKIATEPVWTPQKRALRVQ